MFNYQKTHRFFAQAADGLEELAAAEISELGGENATAAYRGVYFNADAATLYRVNYCARLLTRVLAPLITFDCHSGKYLYRTAHGINWTQVFSVDSTFAVFATVANSAMRHSQYAALKLKDAIVDRFRDEAGRRPNVDTKDPGTAIHLYIQANKATISIDTSGGSLHKRGYRIHSVEAPMQETVAAAAIHFSEWDGVSPLYDPFCGSGTLLAEALMRAANVPASYLRKRFGFHGMPDFDRGVWKRVKAEQDAAIKTIPPGLIRGSDIAQKAVTAAQTNCRMLPGGNGIKIRRRRFEELEGLANTTIISNPPYGLRLGDTEGMPALMKSLGDFLKQRCTGSNAYLYFGKREWIKTVGLRTKWKKPLHNGGLDGRLVKYELY